MKTRSGRKEPCQLCGDSWIWMSLTQVAKVMNIAVQSVLRGVERGEEEFYRREWALANFL